MNVERDGWTVDGQNILAPEALAKVEQTLEREGPIILEHKFYRGSRAPDRLVFDDYEKFLGYVNAHARAGDALRIWNYAELCRDDNSLVNGKFPDEFGRIPRGGAY